MLSLRRKRSNDPSLNEGDWHTPKFRSRVIVDGICYVSGETFSIREAAEEDIARYALECKEKKIKNEGYPLIPEGSVFCKSLLNDFASKMNLEKPTYTTMEIQDMIPLFASSLVFNGVNYRGEPCLTKKEAEQSAARTAILSLLDDARYATLLSELMQTALKNVKDSSVSLLNTTPAQADTLIHNNKEVETAAGSNKEDETAAGSNSVPNSAMVQPSSGAENPDHKFKGSVLCKTILNEFASKMKLELPTYTTVEIQDSFPIFASSLVFNGVTYSGEPCQKKKESEQSAAHAAILSLLDDTWYATRLSKIIQTVLKRVKDSSVSHLSTTPAQADTLIHNNKKVKTAAGSNSVPNSAIVQPSSGAENPDHKFKVVFSKGSGLCKTILNEFANKMKLELPTYTTVEIQDSFPIFASSLVFNGVTYSGEPCRKKKESEQSAARAAILSLLDDTQYATLLSEFIQTSFQVKDSSFSHLSSTPAQTDTLIHNNKEVEITAGSNSVPNSAIVQPSSEAEDPDPKFKIIKSEEDPECVDVPVSLVPPVLPHSLHAGENSSVEQCKKKRKKKKRAKLDTDTQLAAAAVPLNQPTQCSVAL
ncbi:hypothetical protein PTKIN_Ptkin15bG0190100 [Pterospermum kingtungense]